ncbi:MAG TPA: phospho-N-acetylmuramoyl-pentapeptide-transferase [Patescibacteria group bacterium]|jgi:phospho-N-acetylmuramoyl-pentapeptide-transferase|nr:phospho-N-acetylmuramoyl-pentapeptide-transferase [Patescibacteria group bacterium]
MDSMSVEMLTDSLTRTTLLSIAAFVLSMLLTPVYTYYAYRYRFWKRQRTTSTTGEVLEVFTKLHAHKFERSIPTMAGIVGVASVVIVTVAFNMDRAQTWLPLAALIGGAVIGLIDDVINIRGKQLGVAGLRSSLKFLMITVIAVGLGLYFWNKLGYSAVGIPFVGDIELGWLIVPLFALAVVSTGNAVNISDGLDGLAGGLLAQSFTTFGIIALFQGNVGIAGFCFATVGVLLSYLWFNIAPARFYMGDLGSFAYGTALGVVAMLTNTLFLLPVIGILFVAEAGSSLIQIISKRYFGKKIFLSAPLHHHLEAQGWPETKVTMRFWVISAITGFFGVVLALMGGLA